MIKIYHNTQCSKSNECLLFLKELGQPIEVVEYLNTPPTAEQLKEIIGKLGIAPIGLVRQKEPIWHEKFEGKTLSDEAIIGAMVAYPILIERPIVINGDKAVIARPPDAAAKII